MNVSQRTLAKMIGKSQPYISKLVKNGVIECVDGKINVEKAKRAIEEHKDPTRDAQREANQKRREEPSLMSIAGTYPSMADMSDDEKQEFEQEKEELKKLMQESGENIGDDDVDTFEGMKPLAIRLFKEYYQGKLSKLDFQRKSGELISIDEVKKNIFEASKIIRDGLLNIPARLSTQLAYESDPHRCRTILESEINKQLSTLSELLNEY